MSASVPQDLGKLIDTGDLAAVQELVAATPGLASADLPQTGEAWSAPGWKPLHLAAWKGRTRIAAALMEAGAPLDAVDGNGRTALHNAIEAGGREVTDLLIARGATVDICSAAILGRLERLREILAADPSQATGTGTGLTPLEWAAFGNRAEAARLLVASGADPLQTGALVCGASVNAVDVIKYMLEEGADPGSSLNGLPLLHHAVHLRYTRDASPVVNLLLEAGADPNVRDSAGRTPLDQARAGAAAARNGHPAEPEADSKRFDLLEEVLLRHGGKSAVEQD